MSIHDFKKQVKHSYTDEIKNLPFTEIKDIPDIDNPDKYNWVEVGEGYYGRNMYCTKTKIKRGQTMGEFYQGGMVD